MFNKRRLDQTERLIHPAALFRYPELTQHLVGPAGHRTLSQIWLTAFPDLRLEVMATALAPQQVVQVRLLGHGTHKGPLRLGTIDVAPTGAAVIIPFRHTLQVRDRKIVDVTLELDVRALLEQLKAPAAAPRAGPRRPKPRT
jgi:predicted ester cyclase